MPADVSTLGESPVHLTTTNSETESEKSNLVLNSFEENSRNRTLNGWVGRGFHVTAGCVVLHAMQAVHAAIVGMWSCNGCCCGR